MSKEDEDHHCTTDDDNWREHSPRVGLKRDNGLGFQMQDRGTRIDTKITDAWMTATEAERRAVYRIIHKGSEDPEDHKTMNGLMAKLSNALDDANLN